MQQIDNQLTIAAIHARYRDGTSTPQELCAEIKERIAASSDYNAWISVLTDTELKPYLDVLSGKSLEQLPLYGIPFAIKDNIDLADIPTTAACKEYSYTPNTSAVAVQRLIDAGAIPIGKTNLDQFATGLVGTRSPFGAVKNPYNEDYIAGGSSSGSAVAVSLGHVCFALGTDTAGSGRIPAAFNNLVGLKPSLGRISTRGVVPACQSLDCVSVFGLNNYDVSQVYAVLDDYDPDNSFARADRISKKVFNSPITIGIPEEKDLEFFDDTAYQACFNTTVDKLKREHINIVTIDFTPFIEAANMLYQGSWVAERYAAIENFIGNHADDCLLAESLGSLPALIRFHEQHQGVAFVLPLA